MNMASSICNVNNNNIMLKCNYLSEELGSSKRTRGIEEINRKKLTYFEAIHVDEGHKDDHNWESGQLMGDCHYLVVWYFGGKWKECKFDVEVGANAILHFFDVFHDFMVTLYIFS